jgi:TetR/AcrR family transcriptional repressor of nem operon
MARESTRQTILAAGSRLFWERGYGATGIADILAESNVPKGSFYHFFPSKEALLLAVIGEFARELQSDLDYHLNDTTHPPHRRVENLFVEGAAMQSSLGPAAGSALGTLAQEIGAHIPAAREALGRIAQSWVERVAACLDAAPAGEAERRAWSLLCAWEGALMMMKVTGDDRPLNAFLALAQRETLR